MDGSRNTRKPSDNGIKWLRVGFQADITALGIQRLGELMEVLLSLEVPLGLYRQTGLSW